MSIVGAGVWWLGAAATWASAALLLYLAALMAGPDQIQTDVSLHRSISLGFALTYAASVASTVLLFALWRGGWLRALGQAVFAALASSALHWSLSIWKADLETDAPFHHGAYAFMGLLFYAAPLFLAFSVALAGWAGLKADMPRWIGWTGVVAGGYALVNFLLWIANVQNPLIPLPVWMTTFAAILVVWWIGAGWFMARLALRPRDP